MDAFAMWFGYVIILSAAILVLAIFIVAGIERTTHPAGNYTIYSWWDFGVIIAHKEHMIKKIQNAKKAPDSGMQVKSGRMFINAPTWFNKYIYNFGLVK